MHWAVDAISGRLRAVDHLQFSDRDVLESFTLLTYMAARHPRLRFGHTVMCQSFRDPALVAKIPGYRSSDAMNLALRSSPSASAAVALKKAGGVEGVWIADVDAPASTTLTNVASARLVPIRMLQPRLRPRRCCGCVYMTVPLS
jgi:hypothetical protein